MVGKAPHNLPVSTFPCHPASAKSYNLLFLRNVNVFLVTIHLEDCTFLPESPPYFCPHGRVGFLIYQESVTQSLSFSSPASNHSLLHSLLDLVHISIKSPVNPYCTNLLCLSLLTRL